MPDQIINGYTATPEQLKQLRNYSDELLKGSLAPTAKGYTGVAANFLQGLLGNQKMNQANEMQINALNDLSNQTGQLAQQGPGNYSPALIGSGAVNPMAPPEHQALIRSLMSPAPVQDVQGRPGYVTPAQGVRLSPVQQGYQPGYRGEVSVSGEGVKAPMPFPARMPSFGGPLPSSTPNLEGIVKGALPAVNTLRQNAAVGGAIGDVVKQDVQLMNDAYNVEKFAGTVTDLIQANRGQLTWGPTADMSQEVKKGLVNYFPGLTGVMSGQVAAADAIQKMTTSLASVLSRQLGSGQGSDIQLLTSIKTVPGLANSEDGALALADMVRQGARLQYGATQYAQQAQTPQEYQQRKADYMARNHIINPLTGNPIKTDILQEQMRKKFEEKNPTGTAVRPGGARILSVEPPR